MRKILAITRKEVLVRFSSASEWLFFLILHIFFTLVLSGGTGAPSDARIRLVVVDQANTSLSADLVSTLHKSEAVRPDVMPMSQAEDEFSTRRAVAMLVIPAGFDLDLLAAGKAELELRQQPNNINALAAGQAVNSAIRRLSSAVDIASRSVHLISKYMDLSPDEAQSIRYHDGQYIPENRSAAHRESRLTRLLQYADNWCAGVLEDRLNPEKE